MEKGRATHFCDVLIVFLQISNSVSALLLLKANAAIFNLYHGENKLIFNEMK